MSKREKHIYKVMFLNSGKMYEIYAREVGQGGLFGFVEVSGLLFGEKSTIVVDPTEEVLQREFEGVDRTFIPLHSVVRIDEVEKRGTATIHSIRGSGAQAAQAVYSPPADSD
jgi:hypothetical protein